MAVLLPPPIPPLALAVASWIYAGAGIALAFFGRLIWGRLMTLVGLILGGTVGWSVGALLLPGIFAPLALGLVGALIGAMLFTWIVEVALAAMAGALGLYVTYRTLLDYLPSDTPVIAGLDTPLIAGILVLLVIFSVTFYYMHGLLGYVTGLVGGVLTGIGLFLLTGALQLSVAAAVGAAIGGTLLQELVLKRYEERLRAALRRRVGPRRRA